MKKKYLEFDLSETDAIVLNGNITICARRKKFIFPNGKQSREIDIGIVAPRSIPIDRSEIRTKKRKR